MKPGDEHEIGEARGADVRMIRPGDEEWPASRLDALEWATLQGSADMATPTALWVRGSGRLDEVCARAVAIVGTVNATPYGVRAAADLAYGLARRDWTIVSGGGYGIAGAAHRGALAGRGRTLAVVPSGLLNPYPAGHAILYDRIARSGLLVSEWPPDAPSHRHRFLSRNRLIAALAAGTVVLETARAPGPASVARRTLALGRALMAVPGPVNSPLSVGCHDLLRHESTVQLVTSSREVLEALGEAGVIEDLEYELAESEDA
jgi:DNA processing protein